MDQRPVISRRLGQAKVLYLSQRDTITWNQLKARLSAEEVLGINLMNQLVQEEFLDGIYIFLNLYEMRQ